MKKPVIGGIPAMFNIKIDRLVVFGELKIGAEIKQ